MEPEQGGNMNRKRAVSQIITGSILTKTGIAALFDSVLNYD